MLRLTVVSQKVAPKGFLAQSQTQGVDKKVPGLVLLFHEAAGSQAQDVTHCTQQKKEIHL
jgi:hypothetical protein